MNASQKSFKRIRKIFRLIIHHSSPKKHEYIIPQGNDWCSAWGPHCCLCETSGHCVKLDPTRHTCISLFWSFRDLVSVAWTTCLWTKHYYLGRSLFSGDLEINENPRTSFLMQSQFFDKTIQSKKLTPITGNKDKPCIIRLYLEDRFSQLTIISESPGNFWNTPFLVPIQIQADLVWWWWWWCVPRIIFI